MRRPGAVLLLLVTSVVAVQYHWQAAVSLPGPAVQTTSAVSEVTCGLHCESLAPKNCSGFTYVAGDGTCRLFSGDCRGPAADSSQQTTDRYMARHKCPGSISNRCGCPAGFTRCAGRCLALLDQTVGYSDAEALCAELGAHLAVPRSQAENQCAIAAAGSSVAWLGFNDVVTENQFVGADGCGVVPSDDSAWAVEQPNNHAGQSHAMLVPSSADTTMKPGWHDGLPAQLFTPLCQLSCCHQPDCQ